MEWLTDNPELAFLLIVLGVIVAVVYLDAW